jgi:hypothetical protein
LNNSTRTVCTVFGILAGLVGMEHGIGAMLQGNVEPAGFIFESWPNSQAFEILAGEPAISVIPNYLVSGLFAILVSVGIIAWSARNLHGHRGGFALILQSILLLLVGGGFGPPLIGLIVGLNAIRINTPFRWWTRRSRSARQILSVLWPWSIGLAILGYLSLFPGAVLLSRFLEWEHESFVLVASLISFAALFVSIVFGRARDSLTSEE